MMLRPKKNNSDINCSLAVHIWSGTFTLQSEKDALMPGLTILWTILKKVNNQIWEILWDFDGYNSYWFFLTFCLRFGVHHFYGCPVLVWCQFTSMICSTYEDWNQWLITLGTKEPAWLVLGGPSIDPHSSLPFTKWYNLGFKILFIFRPSGKTRWIKYSWATKEEIEILKKIYGHYEKSSMCQPHRKMSSYATDWNWAQKVMDGIHQCLNCCGYPGVKPPLTSLSHHYSIRLSSGTSHFQAPQPKKILVSLTPTSIWTIGALRYTRTFITLTHWPI